MRLAERRAARRSDVENPHTDRAAIRLRQLVPGFGTIAPPKKGSSVARPIALAALLVSVKEIVLVVSRAIALPLLRIGSATCVIQKVRVLKDGAPTWVGFLFHPSLGLRD